MQEAWKKTNEVLEKTMHKTESDILLPNTEKINIG